MDGRGRLAQVHKEVIFVGKRAINLHHEHAAEALRPCARSAVRGLAPVAVATDLLRVGENVLERPPTGPRSVTNGRRMQTWVWAGSRAAPHQKHPP